MLIVRENTECLYVKKERLEDDGKKVVADRVITQKASLRIGEMAFQQAEKRLQGRNKEEDEKKKKRKARVTIVHKSNVLSLSDGLFRESVLEISKKFPHIEVEEQLVDSMVYKLILDPLHYDVVVAPNLYGDILSDAAAALVGGLGVVPSANVGPSFALVEPVHGSAPDIAGKGIANPIATIRAAALLLENLPNTNLKAVSAIEKSIFETLKDGPLTPDLGGNATTQQITDKIISNLQKFI